MRLPLAAKILAGFGLIIAVTALLGVLSITRLASLDGDAQEIFEVDLESVLLISHIEVEALEVEEHMSKGVLAAVMATDESHPELAEQLRHDADELLAEAAHESEEVTHNIETLRASGHLHGEELALLDEVEHEWTIFLAELEEVTLDVAEGHAFAGGEAALHGEGEAAFALFIDELNQMATHIEEAAAHSAAGAHSTFTSARTIILGAIAAAILLGLAVGGYLSWSVSRGAKSISGALQRIAQGDLEAEVANASNDEIGDMSRAYGEMQGYLREMAASSNALAEGDLTVDVEPRSEADVLGNALRTMTENLREIIGGVKDRATAVLAASDQLGGASDQMAAAAGQISSAIAEVTTSATSLSELAQGSATEVEQVAAGSQQLTASSQSNAQAAVSSKDEATQMGERIGDVAQASEQVASGADESRTAALEGQQAVTQAVESMQAIAGAVGRASETVNQLGEYSEQIGNIVQTIDEIAAQTNLLALNAAIEAARAGEQGRGFAVVAENVRTLAERSSGATKEIADLITKVQMGTKDAVEAMETGVKDVEAGREITAQAGTALESIISSVQQSAEQMQSIAGDVQDLAQGADRIVESAEGMASIARESASGAEEMAQGTQKVNEAILQVSSTSEQTSASAEQVSASTEELSAQAQELAATAGEMRSLASALNEASARFTLEAATE